MLQITPKPRLGKIRAAGISLNIHPARCQVKKEIYPDNFQNNFPITSACSSLLTVSLTLHVVTHLLQVQVQVQKTIRQYGWKQPSSGSNLSCAKDFSNHIDSNHKEPASGSVHLCSNNMKTKTNKQTKTKTKKTKNLTLLIFL
jgi:hypothetical protein